MENNIYKKAIEVLPTFFDSQFPQNYSGAEIFEPLRKIIDFDAAYIFFNNPGSIKLKYFYEKNRRYLPDDIFIINNEIKDDLFSQSSKILEQDATLIKLLKLNDYQSFLMSKLIIKNAVFGFILLCKKGHSFYTLEHLEVSHTVSAIISYNIKDIELSEVFKAQLKALQEGIVETKAAYKTIKEQNIKILEADKVKNEFLANISHELRTPLNSIIGFSDILCNQLFGKLNEKQTEYVTDIHIAGIHLMEMINDILDISKIEANAMSLNVSEFSILRVVDEVVNIVMPLADKKSVIIKKNISVDRDIHADFQKIRQILYNLLSNAIKYSPENEKIDVNIHLKKNNLLIEVIDRGIGIAQENHDRIFEKFIQLENAYTKKESSTGLGLTITKQFVKMHNGEIFVESSIGKGAKFSVKIPLKK